jgi:cytochrome P450
VAETLRLESWVTAREALRHRDLRQGLYDEGRALMDGVIVNLHGAPHTDRRRLENRLFRRDTFAYWERELIPVLLEESLAIHREDTSEIDIVPVVRHAMLRLAASVAGLDIGSDTSDFLRLAGLMARLSAASTVVHATGDKAAIIADGLAALDEVRSVYLAPAWDRREALIRDVRTGHRPESDLPRDVLTVLLAAREEHGLPSEVIEREVAYFPWVGSHSTSIALVHALHHCFEHDAEKPGVLHTLAEEPELLQRFVHESLRLHPASPQSVRRAVTDGQLPTGDRFAAGDTVVIDMVAANRDKTVFGDDADRFDPSRAIAEGVAPWGLTFGSGFHACLGQELAGGLPPGQSEGDRLLGAITVMISTLLERGARRSSTRPPVPDDRTTRPTWRTYHVVFEDRFEQQGKTR